MNRIVISFVMLAAIFAVSFGKTQAAENSPGKKYETYQFEPIFMNQDGLGNIEIQKKILFGELKPYWKSEILSSVKIDDSIIFAFQAVLDGNVKTMFLKTNEELQAKGLKQEPSHWDGVYILRQNKNQMLEKKDFRSGQLFVAGHTNYDYYGCIDELPLFKANLVGTDAEELFTVTGYGIPTAQMGRTNCYEIYENIVLTIYLENTYKKLLSIELMLLNYIFPEFECPLEKYYYPAYKEPPSGNGVPYLPCPDGRGRKRFAKVFFKDFNRNDKMDALVWYRQYQAIENREKGFVLEKQWFTWHEETNGGDQIELAERAIDNNKAQQWLKEFKLTWAQGFPDKNLCSDGRKSFPMITDIDDPVLKE